MAEGMRGAGKIKVGGGSNGEIRVSGTPTDLGRIDISGKVYKPSVFYVLGRSDLPLWKPAELPNDFVNKIFMNAVKRPF